MTLFEKKKLYFPHSRTIIFHSREIRTQTISARLTRFSPRVFRSLIGTVRKRHPGGSRGIVVNRTEKVWGHTINARLQMLRRRNTQEKPRAVCSVDSPGYFFRKSARVCEKSDDVQSPTFAGHVFAWLARGTVETEKLFGRTLPPSPF